MRRATGPRSREFLHQHFEYVAKPRACLPVSGGQLGAFAPGLDNQIDRPVLQVQATVGEQRRAVTVAAHVRSFASGQGFCSRQGRFVYAVCFKAWSTLTTRFM